uniref:Dienelactone hydrolase family protein n=1 Tax=Janibacter limosus TaxID=53458 RepID=A0AC61U1H8_9MICO|nr:dienelactone hydrolase family protein [Janibacter limosus]
MGDDLLDDFTSGHFRHDGVDHDVLRSGTGPAVPVIAEVPGITPEVARFARRVRDPGCTVVLPVLFGATGRDIHPDAHGRLGTVTAAARAIGQICVSREFALLAVGRTSPVIPWMRAPARHEHERCGGPGVGVVGMCLTGGFALAMATDEVVVAPVLSQPSLPLAIGGRRGAVTDISDEDLSVVEQRCAAGLQVLGLRFRSDKFCPDARFRGASPTPGRRLRGHRARRRGRQPRRHRRAPLRAHRAPRRSCRVTDPGRAGGGPGPLQGRAAGLSRPRVGPSRPEGQSVLGTRAIRVSSPSRAVFSVTTSTSSSSTVKRAMAPPS